MNQSPLHEFLAVRLAAVEARLQAACRRAGRNRTDVTFVCVTKTVTPATAAALADLGALDLGENRPQELWRKAAALPKTIRWHLIGHLQRNKIERTLPLVQLIHSVDSLRLLEALDAEAVRQQRQIGVLLEINASQELSKHGWAVDDLPGVIGQLARFQQIRVQGLMTMAALEADPEQCRPTFATVRALRDRLCGQMPPPHSLHELSMGMSNDFEIAIEEGATLVRIGTALFEGLTEGLG
jgi:pyridoxal phosphate enzyme (YggS family)